jgi:hypothetical protein
VVIGRRNSDVSKILEISKSNLERTLSKIQIKEVLGNEEELQKELQFIEKIESIKSYRLITLLIQLQISRLFMFVILRPFLLMIRKKNCIRDAILKLKTSFILKSAIRRFRLIQIFQNILGFDLLISKAKLVQYKLELSSRVNRLSKDFKESELFEAKRLDQSDEIQDEKSLLEIDEKKIGVTQKYLISLQAKSELLRHYKKRTKE